MRTRVPFKDTSTSTATSLMRAEHLLQTGTSEPSRSRGAEEVKIYFADVSVMFIKLHFSKSN